MLSGEDQATIQQHDDLDGFSIEFVGRSHVKSNSHVRASSATVTLSEAAEVDIKGDLSLGDDWNTGTSHVRVEDAASLRIGQDLVVGDLARGAMIIEGGLVDVDRDMEIAGGWGGIGSEVQADGGMLRVGGDLFVGETITGSLTVDGGIVVASNDLVIGKGSSTAGSYVVLDAGSIQASSITVGNQSTATYSQTGGVCTTGGTIKVGASSSAGNSSLTLTGGTLEGGALEVGHGNAAHFSQSGGSSHFHGSVTFGVQNGYHSTFHLSGGSFSTDGNLGLNTSTVSILSGGQARIGGNVVVDSWGTSLQLSGADLNVAGNLVTSQGAGVVQTQGAARITGDVRMGSGYSTYQLLGGSLAVGGTLTNQGDASRFEWRSGGTLAAFESGGTIHASGAFVGGPGAVLDLNQELEVLSISGTLILDGLVIDGYDLQLGSRVTQAIETGTITLIAANAIAGTSVSLLGFSSDIGRQIQAGEVFDAASEAVWWFDVSSDSVDLFWSVPSGVVPEPGPPMLLAFAAPFLLRRRR
ncbi:hypothetical protein [Haloferula sargassicola]